MYYGVMNKTKCCGQRICSECIVQVRNMRYPLSHTRGHVAVCDDDRYALDVLYRGVPVLFVRSHV